MLGLGVAIALVVGLVYGIRKNKGDDGWFALAVISGAVLLFLLFVQFFVGVNHLNNLNDIERLTFEVGHLRDEVAQFEDSTFLRSFLLDKEEELLAERGGVRMAEQSPWVFIPLRKGQ